MVCSCWLWAWARISTLRHGGIAAHALDVKILAVEDDAVSRAVLRQALRKLGHEVIEVQNGEEAWKRLAHEPVRVVVSDWSMPRMDGLTFLRLLMERHPMPIVVMSSLTQRGSDYALEALRLGAIEVIGKPAGPYSFGDLADELVTKVKTAAQARTKQAALTVILARSRVLAFVRQHDALAR